jgi:RimJ/RimL family protein N-acetyltransferase
MKQQSLNRKAKKTRPFKHDRYIQDVKPEEMFMGYQCLHDKKEIERYLRRDVYLNIYSLGDLDDFFWPNTLWFGSKPSGHIDAVVLVYVGLPLPTLLAISREHDTVAELLISIRHLLPYRFYAHLSAGLETVLDKTHDLESHGAHYKMALRDETFPSEIDSSGAVRLDMSDLTAIQAFYKKSYPENWFDPRMLETGQYYGIKEENRLVSIAGIHVYSPQYKVAALGNIATLPTHRNKGYGSRATAKLCKSLLKERMRIGLNVKADNSAAISCYKKMGFQIVASYGEFTVQTKSRK